MPVSLSVWRVRIGTFLRRFHHDPKKEAEQSKEDDNANSQNPSSNGSLIDERSKAVNTSYQQPPSSGDVELKTCKTESPSNISSNKIGVCSETLSTAAIPDCDTVNGSPCDIRSPGDIAQHGSLCADDRILSTCSTDSTGKESTPVSDSSDTKTPEPWDLDELDMRYITINGVSPISLCDSTQISEPDQPGGTSESLSQVARAVAGHQDDCKYDQKDTSNSFSPGIHGQFSPGSELDTSSKAEHTLCMREIAEFHGTPISPVSRSRSPSGGTDEIQRNLFCSGMAANVLLLRSGDVEKNPGPNTKPGNLTEFELHLLADGMDPSDFRKVGLALGFTEAQLSRFERDNIGNIMEATYKMLYEWLKTVLQDEAREILSNKLKNINLVQLADKLQKGQVGDHILSLTEEEFKRVIKEVKEYSALHHCQIQADPLNNSLLFQLDRIFTNLTLLEEDKGTALKAPILYADLLKTKVNGVLPKRLLVEGEGGVGKTTLCAKIVLDWIRGTGYQDFKLVLLVLLREVKDKTIGEIIMSYLPDDIKVTAMQLNKYVFSHQKDVLLLLDGFDELAGELDSCYQIALIILNRLFKSGKVLITSRRWRSDEIRKITELRKLYAFIAVEGFSDENLSSYITKFFHPDTTSSEGLNRLISNSDVIGENMAPFPIYTAMLCIMWKDFDGERREAMSKLRTFSQLIDEMVQFLIDHHLSKRNISAGDIGKELDMKRHEILCRLSDIGCLALRGLHERRLVFTEQEFQRWPGSMETGCQVGVLTKQTQTPSRRGRRHRSHSAVTSVQFPHKLFQEYLSGKYLASLHNSNRSEYDNLMKNIIRQAREFRELLYFTSAQQKEVGLDIVSQLIHVASRDNSDITRRLRYVPMDDDFIVDVAYESQDQGVVKAVADHLSTSSRITLEIRNKMQAHTVSGHIFIMNHRKVENLEIKKPCGRTASEDLAEFMCSSSTLRSVTIYLPDYLADGHMHDVFYSVLARNATNTKIEILHHNDDLIESPFASRDLALFICKMNRLKNLTVNGSYHDDFYSTSSSMESTTKIETLCHDEDLSERPSVSRDLALFICKMNRLKNLTLNGSYHEDFYSTSPSMASTTKIETLRHKCKNLIELPSASRDFAQFVCKMNHLKNLKLYSQYHDDFYSTASSMASTTKIETLHDKCRNLIERPSASRDFAQFVCKMNHLKNLKLYNQYHDDFYSTASSMASTTKIETLRDWCSNLSERPSASRDFAQFICKMNHLKNLTLSGRYHDDFYSTSSSMASTTKIETLHDWYTKLSVRPSASRDFAHFICKMNHLKKLTLDGRYHDDFYSTSLSMASTTKIEILHHNDDLRERPSASRDLALFICKMNRLKNLTLKGSYHDDFFSTSSSVASTVKDDCNTSSTVSDLTVTDRTLEGWQDCGSMFDNVKRFTIQVQDTITCDVIQRIHLPAAAELTIQTDDCAEEPASLHGDPSSLPNALHKVSSQLVKVTFRDLNIGNSEIRDIIQAFRSSDDLKHLKILRFIRCGTDESFDSSCIDSNGEHKITVDIVHGKPLGKW